jgi:hypothetical protein
MLPEVLLLLLLQPPRHVLPELARLLGQNREDKPQESVTHSRTMRKRERQLRPEKKMQGRKGDAGGR